MFVRYFVELDLPSSEVVRSLLWAPDQWVPGLAQEAQAAGERLLAQVGIGPDARRIEKQVEIELGVPIHFLSKTVLPLSWRATGPEGLFPELEADLEVAALGPDRTQLSISGRYRTPLGLLGRAMDRALLHRVAEATVKDFLDRAGEALQRIRSGALGDLSTATRSLASRSWVGA